VSRSTWKAPALFWRLILYLPASKNAILSCLLKRFSVLFLFVWHVSSVVVRFSTSGPFVFLFSLPTLKNYSLILLVIGISTSVIILLISHFQSWFSCKNFICFQFYHSIIIYQILYSLIWSSFFGFLIFYFCTFVNVLLIFNFIIQFKLKVLCFPIWLSLFWFFLFFLLALL
jgi:hypothetical protein